MAERIKDEYVESLPPCVGMSFDSDMLEMGEVPTVRALVEVIRIIVNGEK